MSDKLPKDITKHIKILTVNMREADSYVMGVKLEQLADFMLSREEVIAEGELSYSMYPDILKLTSIMKEKVHTDNHIPVKLIAKEE